MNTKIIATIGPATLEYDLFEKVIAEGVDFIRINTSYGDHQQYDRILENLKKTNKDVKVMLDIKSFEEIPYFLERKMHTLAVSFVESAEHIDKVRKEAPSAFIVSKIESQQGVDNFDAILEVSDGVMIARGDLGKAIGLEKIPPLQKDIARKAVEKKKFLVTATEMLLSMVNNINPTRAEVSDVANAVFEGSSAVMLSEETAIGKNPVKCVRWMKKIVIEAERWKQTS